MLFSVDCANVSNGDFGFCHCNACLENEGDCDNHNECPNGLLCGSNNCPDHLAFNSEVDCCYALTVGNEHFCTAANPCGQDEGDCDSHEECQGSLICGSVNCPTYLGFSPDTDCCYDNSQSVVGDETFCTTANPCRQDEGDCDSDFECQNILVCGSNNCPVSLDFHSDVDCCWNQNVCEYPDAIGDSICDDGNNNEACEWDGGDCCDGSSTQYCSVCECLDPDFEGCCQKVKVTHSPEHVKLIYRNIYGTYNLSGIDVYGHNYYVSDSFNGIYAIWWCDEYQQYNIGSSTMLNQCTDHLAWTGINKCVDTFGYDWTWNDYSTNGWTPAGAGLIIECWNPGI